MPIVVNEDSGINRFEEEMHLRSEDVQEFIRLRPSFFIRWGTSLFFLVLVLIGTICWFIQYPEIIFSKARLTSINAPKEVFTRTDGKIQVMLVKNGDSVKQGDALAYMESTANPQSVTLVKIKFGFDSIVCV